MWRYVPLVAVTILYGHTFWWLPWQNSQRFGRTGIVLLRSKSWAAKLRDAGVVVQFVLLSGQALMITTWPDSLQGLMALPLRMTERWQLLATVFLFGGVLLQILAQYDLGASWRLGIEEGARPGLVTTGLYQWCRNPIYLGMVATLVGFAFLVPTWLSLGWLGAALIGFRRQVLEEEAYLLLTYGTEYREYAR